MSETAGLYAPIIGVLLAGLAVFGLSKSKETYAEFESNNNKKMPPPPRQMNNRRAAQMNGSTLPIDGSQSLSYQLYQQAVNAATPTGQQLDSISGQTQTYTDPSSGLGVFEKTTFGNGTEYQAVNMGSERAQNISVCAQNAPTFVASSLLPKPDVPGQSWNIDAPSNILSNQNFLTATQQIGIDTTLSARKHQSYDIRNNIPNPINVVSPWNNTWIMPDLEKRPLDCYVPRDNSIYGCGNPEPLSN